MKPMTFSSCNCLMKKPTAIELIKTKEIMQELEKTTDAADHVGKLLRNIIVKYAWKKRIAHGITHHHHCTGPDF